jgi:alkylhydroperoxidase/carboxymuconolactone decarboxylase family protein YurZ
MRSRFAGAKLGLSTGWMTIPSSTQQSVYKKAGSAMAEDTPVLDTLSEITAVSVDHSSLEAREHMLTRLAALVAVDAPAVSYLVNVGTAADVGVTAEDVQGVLIAVAPIVGTPRVVSAAGNIAEALDFVIDVAVAEAEAEAELASEEA